MPIQSPLSVGVRIATSAASQSPTMCSAGGIWPQIGLFCTDFDDTCTSSDTTPLLPRIAACLAPDREVSIGSTWADLTASFLEGYYGRFKEGMKKVQEDPAASVPGKAGLAELELFLKAMEKPEGESMQRVSESRVLANITREGIKESLRGPLREEWDLRKHASESLTRVVDAPFDHHIISLNFSEDVVRTILEERLGKERADAFSIYSNDLVYDQDGMATGEVEVRVKGAIGKRQHFDALASAVSQPGALTLYVGDSVSDVLAMLSADIGIFIGESSYFHALVDAFGVQVRPLASVNHRQKSCSCRKGEGERNAGDDCAGTDADTDQHALVVYQAHSWSEIDALLFGDVNDGNDQAPA
ncbi:unnamed protein product [Chrysoparadoxa australica]